LADSEEEAEASSLQMPLEQTIAEGAEAVRLHSQTSWPQATLQPEELVVLQPALELQGFRIEPYRLLHHQGSQSVFRPSRHL
jgi:hypothetical protein